MFEFIVIILTGMVVWLYNVVCDLKQSVKRLERKLSPEAAARKKPIINTPPPEHIPDAPKITEEDKPSHIWDKAPDPEPTEKPAPTTAPPILTQKKTAPSFQINENFISKLPIWIGGIACFLAAFYFVKYSIDNNLIGPWGQCIIASLFGLSLLKIADKIRLNISFHHHILLGQSVTGAGLMVLYATSYAATHYYDLIPLIAGFAAMTAVTGLAILLSLRHGVPIALMALIAAFVTPALFSNNTGSAPALFSYVFVLFSGFMFLCYKQGWKLLSYITIAFSFLWIWVWLERSTNPFDSTIISLFLIAISSVIVAIEHKILKSNMSDFKKFLLTPSMVVVILSLIVFAINFLSQDVLSFHNLFLYGLLALATMALAYFAPEQYRYYPYASLSLSLLIFLFHKINTSEEYIAFILTALTLTGTAYGLWYKSKSDLWSKILTYAASGFFIIFAFNHWNSSWMSGQDILPYQTFIIGVLICVFLTNTAKQALSVSNQNAISHFAGGATLILAISCAHTLPNFTLLGALACQILALIWINSYIQIKSLKIYVYSLLTVILLPICFITLLEATKHLDISIRDIIGILSVTVPIFIAPFLLNAQQYSKLRNHLEIISLFLVTITAGALLSATFNIFDIQETETIFSSFNLRSITLNAAYILSVAFTLLGVFLGRQSYKNYGIAFFGITLSVHLFFDYLIANPLLTEQSVAGILFLNMLFLNYIMPFLYGFILWKIIGGAEEKPSFLLKIDRKYLYIVPSFIMLFWLSLNIRFLFAGSDNMHDAVFANAEIYTYSVVWLIYATSLMLLGIIRNINLLRQISLAFMLIIAAKVFLYDASELSGLWRVASFLGLGLSLIGISWLYGFTTKRIEKSE